MWINTDNLQTARENVGYTTLEATKKVCGPVKADKVKEWESEGAFPTWRQLKELANAYQVNVFLLTSKERIAPNRQIPDYRTTSQAERPDINTKKFIHFLLQRQDYLTDILKDEGFKKNKLVSSGSGINNPQELAQFIARKTGYRCGNARDNTEKTHLKYLISLLEDQGVFVMKTLSYWPIEVNCMRGVYLKSEYAPIIALNRRDAKTAQLFTLAHEIAHLVHNSEGISNMDFRDQTNNNVESFCNKVAANLLLPKDQIKTEGQDDLNKIDKIAKIFQVSELCVFYRLKSSGWLEGDHRQIDRLEQQINSEHKKDKALAKPDEDRNNKMKDSNGYLFNNFISSLYFENKINAAEASRLLKLSINEV